MAGVGDILICVHRSTEGAFDHDKNLYRAPNPKDIKEVSEKALKGQAISHNVA